MSPKHPIRSLRHAGRLLARGRALVEGHGHLVKLMEAHPELQCLEEEIRVARAELLPLRQAYTSSVSSGAMALSLEAGALTRALLVLLRPSRVADLGSGFSSVVLRSAQSGAACWSVDDSATWLERTRTHLEVSGMDADRMEIWADLRVADGAGFELLVYDLGSTDSLRPRALPAALDLLKPGGWILIDDLQVPAYRRCVRRSLAEGFDLYRTTELTMDWRGRYAWLARKVPVPS